SVDQISGLRSRSRLERAGAVQPRRLLYAAARPAVCHSHERHILKGASTMRTLRSCASLAIAAGALVLGGCTDWLAVDNPGVIDQGVANPVADAPMSGKSVPENFHSVSVQLDLSPIVFPV